MEKDKNNQVEPEVINSELDELKQKAQEYLDGWKRAQADFVNYKKDELKRVQYLAGYQTEGILEDVIGIADIFDSAFKAIPPDQQEQNKKWLEGIGYARKQIDQVLKKNGVEKIDTSGQFDPMIHEAIDSEVEDQKSAKMEEMQAGYKIGDRVLRPARVSLKK